MGLRARSVLGVVLLGCGPSVDDDGAAGTTTGVGETTIDATASATTSSSSSDSSSSTSVEETSGVDDTTGPGGIPCGNEVCGADQLCEWAKDSCGAPTDPPDQQRCSDRPTCDLDMVCACDGMTYHDVCAAFDAGVDLAAAGGCTIPPLSFPCGSEFCVSKLDWCLAHVVDISSTPDEYSCHPVPAECDGMPSCDCIDASDQCTNWSCEMVDGGVVIRC